MTKLQNLLSQAGIAVAAFALPILFVHFTAPEPRTRRIHVDHYRYGMVPEVIHVNRGDTVVFTFSTRDTPHSFFLQEYDIDVKMSPNTGEVEVARPSDPDGEPELAREVTITAGRPGLAGFFNTKARYRCHVYCGEMHGFEQGTLVVHPNYLHAGATGLLFAIPLIGLLRRRRRNAAPHDPPAERQLFANLFERWPRFRAFLSMQGLQFWLMSIMSVLLYVVLLTTLLGTRMAGGNLGILLLWVVWLFALVVLFVPLGGRAWCTVCPIPMLGDAIQRGSTLTVHTGTTGRYNNRLLGLMRAWPKALANRVPRTIFFLGLGTVSILIVSQPRWTGWALVLLVVLATALPLVFELRAFCRYLCPINSFISLYARMGRLALRTQREDVCHRCHELDKRTCHKGNECGWACPYGLTASEIATNSECGLCLECLRSCSYQNVTLNWRPFGLEGLVKEKDEALQAIVMFTLAVVYCVTFLGPWHGLREMVNIVDMGNWGLFALYAIALWVLTLAIMPVVVHASAVLGARASGARGASLIVESASPLVPMGLFVWIAFSMQMLAVEGSFVLSTLSDPFGWGWNLFGTAGHPWKQLWPEAIPWLQSALVLIGFGAAVRTAHRVWIGATPDESRALRGMLPMCTFLFMLSAALIWFFAA
jgi:polyferredoxin